MRPLLICMTPVRNEAWVLHAFLKATSLWADYIIIADQMSIDGSREIALSYPKVILIDNNNPDFNESERQKLLIDKAREIKGDKILFGLDADEIFTANFLETADWSKIINSKPGSVFWFKWLQVLEDKIHGFETQNYYPWVFHDDNVEPHSNYVANIHSMRIPYPIEEKQMFYIDDFKVLHFQHFHPQRNESKQRFYMFVDYSLNKRNPIKLSRTYLKKPIKEKVYELSVGLFYNIPKHGFDIFENIKRQNMNFWFDKYIVDHLLDVGVDSYRKIQIWDKSFVAEYNLSDPRNLFVKVLHFYLKSTKNISSNFMVRVVDKVLIKIGL